MVITGDITQIDLQNNNPSGLIHALNILNHLDGVKFVKFTSIDVMRHPLVSKIISCYEGNEND